MQLGAQLRLQLEAQVQKLDKSKIRAQLHIIKQSATRSATWSATPKGFSKAKLDRKSRFFAKAQLSKPFALPILFRRSKKSLNTLTKLEYFRVE